MPCILHDSMLVLSKVQNARTRLESCCCVRASATFPKVHQAHAINMTTCIVLSSEKHFRGCCFHSISPTSRLRLSTDVSDCISLLAIGLKHNTKARHESATALCNYSSPYSAAAQLHFNDKLYVGECCFCKASKESCNHDIHVGVVLW